VSNHWVEAAASDSRLVNSEPRSAIGLETLCQQGSPYRLLGHAPSMMEARTVMEASWQEP